MFRSQRMHIPFGQPLKSNRSEGDINDTYTQSLAGGYTFVLNFAFTESSSSYEPFPCCCGTPVAFQACSINGTSSTAIAHSAAATVQRAARRGVKALFVLPVAVRIDVSL